MELALLGEQLKIKQPNYLIPPYRKPTAEEQQRYQQSNQLSILPILQPTPQQLIQHQEVQVQKPKQLVKTKPTIKPSPKHKQGTLPLSTSTTPKNSKTDLKKQKEEMLNWLNNVKIQ